MNETNIFKKMFAALVAIFAVTFLANGSVIYVDLSATGNNNGTSWCDAYLDLQSALDVASSGDEIRVAYGTYKPGSSRSATFRLVNGVTLKGGYVGCFDPGAERNPGMYLTVLSGDIGTINDDSDNCYHVVIGSSTDATTVLDGFIITKGNANGSNAAQRQGGGMYNYGGSPTISNCTFSSNKTTGDGGGMYNDYSSPSLSNCTFDSNEAKWNGGGMYNYRSGPTISNCTFIDNTAQSLGGGMLSNGNAVVTKCTFSGNSVNPQSGFGGGIFSSYGSPVFKNCLIIGNEAFKGAGFAINGFNLEITNCTIYKNEADNGSGVGYGGAIYSYGNDPNTTVCNSILWDDIASSGPEIYIDAGTVNVTYSDVDGGWIGTGNINADPKFVDPDGEDDEDGTADDNFRLLGDSPCIDAGDNSCAAGITTDLDGFSRFVDDPDTTDTGSGTAPIVDMGAYEYQVKPRLLAAVSRKSHGTAGEFDIPLALDPAPGEAGVECRDGGPEKVVLFFTEPIASGQISLSCGTLDDVTINGSYLTIDMSSVPNECCLCITLTDVQDLQGDPLVGVKKVYIGVLRSDVNGDGIVDTLEYAAIKSQMFKPVTQDNCRCDVSSNGVINIFDLSICKSDQSTSVSCPGE